MVAKDDCEGSSVDERSNVSGAKKKRPEMPVLIAAKPDRMRESLRILLRLVDGINIVGQASDERSTLRMIAKHRPALVLLDTNLRGRRSRRS